MVRRAVIGYDGSDEAKRAVEFAARTILVDCAFVVNVWHDPGVGIAPGPMGAPPPIAYPLREGELERGARAVAEEGADQARRAGMDAFAAARAGGGPGDVARVLHTFADECDGEMIVVGRRPMSLLEGALLGSVSLAAVRDERHPVLVVPTVTSLP